MCKLGVCKLGEGGGAGGCQFIEKRTIFFFRKMTWGCYFEGVGGHFISLHQSISLKKMIIHFYYFFIYLLYFAPAVKWRKGISYRVYLVHVCVCVCVCNPDSCPTNNFIMHGRIYKLFGTNDHQDKTCHV